MPQTSDGREYAIEGLRPLARAVRRWVAANPRNESRRRPQRSRCSNLAEQAGVSDAVVRRLLDGEIITLDAALRVAAAIGYWIEWSRPPIDQRQERRSEAETVEF